MFMDANTTVNPTILISYAKTGHFATFESISSHNDLSMIVYGMGKCAFLQEWGSGIGDRGTEIGCHGGGKSDT